MKPVSVVIAVAGIWLSLAVPAVTSAQTPDRESGTPQNRESATPQNRDGATPQNRESGTPQKGPATAPPANNTQLVSIDFNNVDIGVFIKFVSDLTKRNFVVDDKVRGKVTIISPGKITVQEAYKVFESVLEVYGFATVQSGEITKIIPSPDARTKNIKTRLQEESGLADDTVVTQIIPLRYADPNEIKNLFTPLISRNSVIQAYPPTNTLIVTDVNSNIKRLMRILKAIDITGVGQQIAIIPVENASAAKLVTLLESIFRSPQKPKAPGTKDITFVADERTNVLVVLASEGDVDNIRQLVKTLDKETPKGQGNINVYYLEHASAEDLVKVLQDIPQKGTEAKEGGKPVAPVVSSKVRISADKATNSLIIMADTEDYLVLESIIKKIDIPRAMVYMEALIMEVNVTKDFRLGTEWLIGDTGKHDDKEYVYGGGFQGETPLVGAGTGLAANTFTPTLPSGFSVGLFGEALTIAGISFPSITAVINAFKRDRDVRILSTPQILTTDNQEAKIYVGRNLPFQTTATLSTSSAGEVYNSFEYRDVGKTLKITPQISKDRMVRLVLSLEVTALESTTDFRPVTLKRTIDTTAIVRDGHTVVLGGLIDDSSGNTVVKVPCLGDIPLLGNLFRTKANNFEKSNLYIFLTPKVIQNSNEASKVSSSKRTQIENLRGENINLYDRKNTLVPSEELQITAPPDQQGDEVTNDPTPQGSSMGDQPDGRTGALGSSSEGQPGSAPPSSPERTGLTAPQEAHSAQDVAVKQGRSPEQAASQSEKDSAAGPAGADPAAAGSLHEQERPAPGGVQGYTLQVASVQSAEKAAQLLKQLTGRGYAAYTVRMEIDGAVWYRIRIGYFADKNEAALTIDQLKNDRYTPILIKL